MDSTPDRTNAAEQQLQEQLLEGVQGSVKQAGKIREQLRSLFEPYDYVTVKNPFERITGWAYVDPATEHVERPDKTTRRVTHGAPQTRVLKPGEQIVIHGWEAYIAIERMFKEYAQQAGNSMTVVISSQVEIDKFIAASFGGVFDPNQQINAINAQQATQAIQAQEAEAAKQPQTADPLGFGAPEQTTPAPSAPTQPTEDEFEPRDEDEDLDGNGGDENENENS